MSERNHRQWAEWFYYNHSDYLDQEIYNRYGIEFNLSKKKKIDLFTNILSKHWSTIHKMTFSMKCQLYWSRIKDSKRQVVLSLKVNRKNYFIAKKNKDKWKNGKK